MALELKIKVIGLGEAVKDAGYTVIDSTRNELESGTTSIDIDGNAIIPITSKYVGEGEALRVTIDNYGNGVNFEDSGSATDVVRATSVFVNYAVTQRDGYFVTCTTETGKSDPWDMGDGNTLDEENPTHLYLANGTYTITSGEFSTTVVVTGVQEFDVSVIGNKVICKPQSGTTGRWDFGDGSETEVNAETEHEYFQNGTYLVSNSGFEYEVIIDYFSDGIVKAKDGNHITFSEPEPEGSSLFNYGDGTFGEELEHVYATHGNYLVINGERVNYVIIGGEEMPTAGFTMVSNPSDTSIVTFTGKGGDVYESIIEGTTYNTLQVEHDFDESGTYPYEIRAINVNGNAAKLSTTIEVYTNNTAPTGELTYSSNALEISFDANVVDNDFKASHTYLWTFNAGEEFEETSTEASPTHTYFPPETPNDPAGQTFTVTCKVTDDKGAELNLSTVITVYDFKTYSENLVVNGDFTDSDLDGWVTSNDLQVFFEKQVHEGRDVMYVYSTGGSQGYVGYQVDNLEVGAIYDIGYTMKANGNIVFASDTLGLTIEQGGALTNGTKVDNGDFTLVEHNFEALTSTVTLRVNIRRADSELWLDSINLSKGV